MLTLAITWEGEHYFGLVPSHHRLPACRRFSRALVLLLVILSAMCFCLLAIPIRRYIIKKHLLALRWMNPNAVIYLKEIKGQGTPQFIYELWDGKKKSFELKDLTPEEAVAKLMMAARDPADDAEAAASGAAASSASSPAVAAAAAAAAGGAGRATPAGARAYSTVAAGVADSDAAAFGDSTRAEAALR